MSKQGHPPFGSLFSRGKYFRPLRKTTGDIVETRHFPNGGVLVIRKTGLEIKFSDTTTFLFEYKQKSNDVLLTVDDNDEYNLELSDLEMLHELLAVVIQEMSNDKMENLL